MVEQDATKPSHATTSNALRIRSGHSGQHVILALEFGQDIGTA